MIEEKIDKSIAARRKILHDYILLNLELRDYHAISDAANDLRVMDAFEAGLKNNDKKISIKKNK